jgi:hypothetical protein
LRWLLVRDPENRLRPQAFLSTDTDADSVDMLTWFRPAVDGRGHLRRGLPPPEK